MTPYIEQPLIYDQHREGKKNVEAILLKLSSCLEQPPKSGVFLQGESEWPTYFEQHLG